MLLAGHLYRVTMQKVPQILRQKTRKNLKKLCFSNQKAMCDMFFICRCILVISPEYISPSADYNLHSVHLTDTKHINRNSREQVWKMWENRMDKTEAMDAASAPQTDRNISSCIRDKYNLITGNREHLALFIKQAIPKKDLQKLTRSLATSKEHISRVRLPSIELTNLTQEEYLSPILHHLMIVTSLTAVKVLHQIMVTALTLIL